MKKIIFPDLYERVRESTKTIRNPNNSFDDKGNFLGDSLSFECFEFLIFLEVKDSRGELLLHYPVAIGHEALLKETAHEQKEIYSRLLPAYSVAVLAVENSLTRFDEWELFDAYPTPETLVENFFKNAGRHRREDRRPVSNFPDVEKGNSGQFQVHL